MTAPDAMVHPRAVEGYPKLYAIALPQLSNARGAANFGSAAL